MPAGIEPIAVQLPGRADRFAERPFGSRPELVEVLAGELAPLLDQPFAFYGHSMGATIAWTLAHRFRDKAMPAPSALYLANTAAPDLDEERQLRWQDDVVGYLRSMGATRPEVFDQPELLASLLPMVRADLTLVDCFRFRPAVPLDMPIHAFAGAEDAEGAPERMSGWRFETRGRFDLDVVKGGHSGAQDQRRVRLAAGVA
jgi:medium-chain acyl-[acyl-carrier-protein] hydrolase